MTTLLYGRPPAVFDPPGAATQTSPLIPGATALESLPENSADSIMIYAPPGVLERRSRPRSDCRRGWRRQPWSAISYM